DPVGPRRRASTADVVENVQFRMCVQPTDRVRTGAAADVHHHPLLALVRGREVAGLGLGVDGGAPTLRTGAVQLARGAGARSARRSAARRIEVAVADRAGIVEADVLALAVLLDRRAAVLVPERLVLDLQ